MNAPVQVPLCTVCGVPMPGRTSRARFCSTRCRSWRHRNPTAIRGSHRLCWACGERFEPTSSRQVWCSARCRLRAHRRKVSRAGALAAQWDLEARDFWRTPPWLFRRLDDELHFGLDAATAGPSDALVDHFLTPDEDALNASWSSACAPGRPAAFCNPPYSRKGGRGEGLLAWARAAVRARDEGLVVALLVPPSPGTRYHRLLHHESVEHWMPDRRLAFIHPDTGLPVKGNRGDSMVAILRPGQAGPAAVSYISRGVP